MRSGSKAQLCRMVRTHFNSLRQRQRQSRDLTTITDDVKFVIRFVGDSVPRPVPVLLEMGMIIVRDYIAFNLAQLSTHLAIVRKSSILLSLHRDGWKDVEGDTAKLIAPLVGENEVKNWSVLEYPVESEIGRLVMTNKAVMATEAELKEDGKQEGAEVPDDIDFPLVAIEYERELVTGVCEITMELGQGPAVKKFVNGDIVKCEEMSFRVPDAK